MTGETGWAELRTRVDAVQGCIQGTAEKLGDPVVEVTREYKKGGKKYSQVEGTQLLVVTSGIVRIEA